MSRRGVAANRLEGLRDLVSRLVGAILDGQAATSVKARHAAFAGGADGPAVAHYLDVVRRHAYRITDEDVERLRDAGLDDDAIFELTVAAALGAGAERLRVGLALLGREPQMRLSSYEAGALRRQRAFVGLTRVLGGEVDDVGKVALRRPAFFGRPFLSFAHSLLRGPSAWSVGERELFAAVVSRANSCQFCVATHGEIAAKQLGRDVLERLDEGRFSPPAAAAATFVEALTRDPHSVSAGDLERARAAGVEDDALAEAIYVAFMFNTINRVADALGFEHRSDRDRRRGAAVLRRLGYRLPGFLLR